MFKSLLPWKRTKTKVVVPECTMEEVGTNELVVPKEKLVPCPTCGRTFLPQPLSKHAPICEKTWTKKRKVFDSLRQRVEGTDLAQFHRKTYLKRTVPEVSPKPSDSKIVPKISIHSTSSTSNNRKSESKWEQNHLQVLSAIRTAREAAKMADPRPTTSKKSPSSLLPASPNSQCPFCERNFGPKAFDRHVDWCREHSSRIHKSPAVNSQAKERLEARIKYRAPPLRQSKRSMIREKYASLNAYKPKSTTSVVPAGTSDSSSNRKSPSVNHVTVKSKPKSVLELGSRGDKVEVRSPVAKARIAEKKTKSESKLQEPVKSLRGKMCLPREKLNSIRVNSDALDCMIVSPIVKPKLVTWKDLSKNEKLPLPVKIGDSSTTNDSVEQRSVTIFYENPNMFDDDDGNDSEVTVSTLDVNPKIDNLDEVFNFEVSSPLSLSVQSEIVENESFLLSQKACQFSSNGDLSTSPKQQPELGEDYRKILCDSSDNLCKEFAVEVDLETVTDSLASLKNVKVQASENSSSSSSLGLSDSLMASTIENNCNSLVDDHDDENINIIEKLEGLHLNGRADADNAVFYFSNDSSKSSSTSSMKVFSCLSMVLPKDFKTVKDELDYQIPRKRLKLVDNEETLSDDNPEILNTTFTILEDEEIKNESFLPAICQRPSHLSNISEREEIREEKSVLQLPVINGAVSNRVERSIISSPKSDYNPFECAQRQFQQLLDCDDFVPPTKKIPAKSNVDKVENRKSVIEPPATFQDFDPSEDDFEILEQLLNNIDNSNNENKIFRKYSDDMSSIDSNLINENDNLSIPEHFKLDNYSPNSTETLKNVDNVDPYSVEYDNSIESVNRISVKIDSGSSSASDTSANNNTKKNLKKGAILLETLSKPPLMRSREDVNNYFQEKDAINKLSDDNNDNQIENNFTAEELFSVDDEMYEEYKLYEEMYLKDRDGAANSAKKKSSKTNNFDYGVPNIIKSADNADENNPKSSKYIDSAYGSLHRNTPKSEEIKEKIIPRFCHECGTKYPVNWAKFCVECGMKRLVLS